EHGEPHAADPDDAYALERPIGHGGTRLLLEGCRLPSGHTKTELGALTNGPNRRPALPHNSGQSGTPPNTFEPELFSRTAFLACESEILEFPTEQNWFDTDNDHFRSAVGTCRRSFCFGWRF